jgi:hypothetical protein
VLVPRACRSSLQFLYSRLRHRRQILRASAVVNQTSVSFLGPSPPFASRCRLILGVKESCKEIKIKCRDGATGFFIRAVEGRQHKSGKEALSFTMRDLGHASVTQNDTSNGVRASGVRRIAARHRPVVWGTANPISFKRNEPL